MATILSIDESTGTQGDDTTLALPTALLSDLTALFPGGYTVREKAKNASGLTFAASTTDIGFTDGAGAALNGLDSGLLSIDGRKLFLYTYSGDNNLVIARAGTAGGLADPAGAISFVGYLQPNTASGSDTGATTAQLWVVEFGNLQHNLDGANVNDFVTLTGKLNVSATNPITFNADKAPSGSSLFVAYGDGTPVPTEVGVIVTAVGAVTSGNISGGNVVKASQAGASLGGATFGVNSQHFDGPGGSGGLYGDAAYFTFVKGLATELTVPNLDQNESDVESNIGFSNLFGTTKVSFVVCQMQGPNYATVKISAMRASVVSPGATPASADDSPYTGTLYVDNQDFNTLIDIDRVTIKRGNDSWTFEEGAAVPPPGAPANLTVDFSGDGYLTAVIAGAAEGDTIVYETVAEHNRLRIGAPGNSVASLNTAFDIGKLQIVSGVTTTSPLGDIDFYDDGPTISGAATQPILAVDESDFTVDDTDAFAPSFTRAFGTDGAAASGSVTYALGIAAGASGVTDSGSGLAVVLSLENEIVYGRAGAGGPEVFRISVDASGNVTLNQSRAVMHNDVNDDDESGDSAVTLASDGLVTLSSTVKDRDNDTQTAVLNIGQNIQLEDDGPTISASTTQPLLTVDESTLPNSASGNFAPVFTSAFGADGQAASNPLTYTLGINSGASGIKDTATGLDVVLSVVGGVVYGRAGTAANSPEVFRVSVNASGNVTLAQSRAVVHDNPADPEEANPSAVMLAADTLVTLTARATDKDGDFKTATANIGLNLEFEDDGPGIGPIADGIVDFVKDATVSKSLLGVVGNDPNAAPYTLTDWTGKDSDPADTIIIAGVTLKAVANAGATSVTYWANTNDNIVGNAGDTAYYRLDLSQTGAGSYTFTVLQPPPVVEHHFTFADQPAGQNLFGIIAHDKDNVSGTAPDATLPDGGLLFFNSGVVVDPATGQYTNASSTVNTSKGGGEVSIGYGANNYTAAGQNAYFVFADNPNSNAVGGLGLTQTTADLAHTVRFEGTNEVTSAAVEIVKIVSGSPCGVTVRAYNLDPDDSASLLDVDDNAEARSFLTDPLAFGGPDNEAEVCDIVGVRIWSSNTTLTDATLVYSGKDLDDDGDFTEEGEFTTTGNVTVVKNDDGSFTVTSMDTNKNYTIRYDTTTPHDMARIDHVAGSYNIGGFNLVQSDAVPDQKFDFTARVTDGDGDTASDSWSVVIDGTGVWDDDEYTTEAPSSLAILPAFKDPGFVDDSGMFATLNHIDYFA